MSLNEGGIKTMHYKISTEELQQARKKNVKMNVSFNYEIIIKEKSFRLFNQMSVNIKEGKKSWKLRAE